MNCTAILCLSGLFIEGGIGYVQPPQRVYGSDEYVQAHKDDRRYDIGYSANPMGTFSFGHEWEGVKWRVSLEFRHESWLGTRQDKGLNGAWTSIRYRPFAR